MAYPIPVALLAISEDSITRHVAKRAQKVTHKMSSLSYSDVWRVLVSHSLVEPGRPSLSEEVRLIEQHKLYSKNLPSPTCFSRDDPPQLNPLIKSRQLLGYLQLGICLGKPRWPRKTKGCLQHSSVIWYETWKGLREAVKKSAVNHRISGNRHRNAFRARNSKPSKISRYMIVYITM